MDKRKWLWKKRSSDRSSGETESSESISSLFERSSDEHEQESLRASSNSNTQSPEVTSKAAITDDEVKEIVKGLTEKLSAALVNVSEKEDLVQQHAKVAEEAVAGWEQAENEVVDLKQQLEAAIQQNVALEVRASHLDGALKESVRQLRRAKEDERRFHDALVTENSEWKSIKVELESKILELESHAEASKADSPASNDPHVCHKLEFLEKENSMLKADILSLSEELAIRSIERETSTQAAEKASKQQLDSMKRVAKLEAECRRLQETLRKSSYINAHKPVPASSFYAESLTDSRSEPSISDPRASALTAELEHFKSGKAMDRNVASCSIKIDLMGDFLEMEQLAALSETNKTPSAECCAVFNKPMHENNSKKAQQETLSNHAAEFDEKLFKIEAEKAELEKALKGSQDSLEASRAQLREAENRLKDLQEELALLKESKELLKFKLIGTEAEAQNMATNISSLNAELQKKHTLEIEMAARGLKLENELKRKSQEAELHQTETSTTEPETKQEDFSVAADKLAECQRTIASLGKQLQSLATLEDFLIDTANLPGFSGARSLEIASLSVDKNDGESSASSSSSSSSSRALSSSSSSSKSRNNFVKLFSRSKGVAQLENRQG